MEMVASPLFRTGAPDGHDEPSPSADDRGHDDPQSVAGDAAILSLRRCQIQPSFQRAAGSARHGAGPRLPAPPHRPEAVVVAHQPGRVRLALLLRRHARARRTSDTSESANVFYGTCSSAFLASMARKLWPDTA